MQRMRRTRQGRRKRRIRSWQHVRRSWNKLAVATSGPVTESLTLCFPTRCFTTSGCILSHDLHPPYLIYDTGYFILSSSLVPGTKATNQRSGYRRHQPITVKNSTLFQEADQGDGTGIQPAKGPSSLKAEDIAAAKAEFMEQVG